MAAQTVSADRTLLDPNSTLPRYEPPVYLKSGQTLLSGQVVFLSLTDGFAYGAPATNRIAIGLWMAVDVTATSDTSTQVAPQRAAAILVNSSTSALASADVGKMVYSEDNQTVRLDAGSGYSPCGTFIGFKGTAPVVEVGVGPLASMASFSTTPTLASTSSGSGASLIGVQDSAAYFTGAQVEAVLAELGKNLPIEITDPGTAAAIPVTHSGTIMLTIGAGAETNTLAVPTFVGQKLIITVGAISGGTRAITSASAINVAGNTIMTFNEVRDNIELRAVKVGSSLAWEVGFNAAVALS